MHFRSPAGRGAPAWRPLFSATWPRMCRGNCPLYVEGRPPSGATVGCCARIGKPGNCPGGRAAQVRGLNTMFREWVCQTSSPCQALDKSTRNDIIHNIEDNPSSPNPPRPLTEVIWCRIAEHNKPIIRACSALCREIRHRGRKAPLVVGFLYG